MVTQDQITKIKEKIREMTAQLITLNERLLNLENMWSPREEETKGTTVQIKSNKKGDVK